MPKNFHFLSIIPRSLALKHFDSAQARGSLVALLSVACDVRLFLCLLGGTRKILCKRVQIGFLRVLRRSVITKCKVRTRHAKS